MNIVYISCLCSKDKYNKMFENSNVKPGQQVQKYHRLITEGLSKNNNIKVKVLTALPITKENFSKIIIKSEEEKINGVFYKYLFMINIPVIKNIIIFWCAFINTLIECIKQRETVVICDVLNISVTSGALLASKILRKKSVGIVTDIPIHLTNNKNTLLVKLNNYIMKRFSSYIFLTNDMNLLINKDNKPYVIIEGQVDINMRDLINEESNKYDPKVCIYSGGIQKIYGIKYLCEAFIKANIEKTELHIYGSGDFEEELKTISTKYKNIKYFGVVSNDYVVQEQLKATLLINPRPTSEEYTKYSFPSKNMEYMVSGTPTLTTKLPGMPDEYNSYIYLIEEETVDGLSKTLKNLLNKSSKELFNKGALAKEFVLKEKNNIIQSKKIIDMVSKLL